MYLVFSVMRRGINRRGVAAIETALVLPLFLFLILAIIETGWQLLTEMTLQNGAEDAARFVETGNTSDSSIAAQCWSNRADAMQQLVREEAPTVLSKQVTIATAGGGDAANTVQYIFTYSQPYLTSWARSMLGNAMTHTVRVQVRNDTEKTSQECSS